MGLEKTTTFAGLVWVAGLLALLLFRDAFAGSVLGIILGLLLSVLMLVATYLIMDGVKKMLQTKQEREEIRQKTSEDKLYGFMQEELYELLDFEKETFEAVKKLRFREKPEKETVDPEMLERMAETMNETTMRAARLILTYYKKTSAEMQHKLDTLLEEISDRQKEEQE